MIASSATAGQPRRPSTPDSSPSFIWAPSVSRGSWACWATTPSNALTYSSARRISTASETHLPSSEKTRTRAARVGHRAELGEPLAAEPDGDRADRLHVAVPGLAAEPPHLLDHAGGVGDRVGVGHRVHRGEAAERRGRGCRSRRSRRPRGRARAGGCAGRPGPGSATSPSASTTSAPAAARPAPTSAMHAVRRAAGRSASPPSSRAPLMTYALMPLMPALASVARRRRAAGRARPSGRSTPLVTCSTMTERAESATSAAISMPRFIGPGCMTIACSGSCAIRARVEAVAAAVLARAREERGVHPLALHPQHHHDVALGAARASRS